MKKFCMVLFTLLSFSLFAKEFSFYKGKCYQENIISGLNDFNYEIRYNTEDDVYIFVMNSYFSANAFFLDSNTISQLRTNIEKYFEWEKLAKEKGVELYKQLPNSDISTMFIYIMGDDVYSAMNFIIQFKFFSQSTTCHQLIVSGVTQASVQNEFIDCSMDSLYFDYDQVKSLYDAFSDENIAAKKKEFEEQLNIDELFQ